MGSLFSYWKLSNFTRKQPFLGTQATGLRRVLTKWHLLGFALANIIGAGIFVTSGSASLKAGSSLVFAFIIAGVAALFSALCYAEYSARYPVSGSSYSFSYISLGEALAWFIGWNMTLEYAVSASALAAGWAGNVVSLLQVIFPRMEFPSWLYSNGPIYWEFTFSPLAVLILLICTVIIFTGITESATFNVIISTINVIIILFVIILGATFWNSENWNNFLGDGISSGGFNGILTAAGIIFYSYIGFDAVTTLSGESVNPNQDLPFVIFFSLAIATSLYIAVAVVLTGIVTADRVNIASPLAFAFKSYRVQWAVIVIAIGTFTTLTANVLASLFGQPRIFFQMAVDGLLFKPFSWVNTRGVMTLGSSVTFIISGILALVYDLNSLSHMISAGTLMAYGTVCAGVIILRYNPPLERNADDALTLIQTTTYFSFSNTYGDFVRKYLPIYLFVFVISSIFIGVAVQGSWHVSVIVIFSVIDFFLYLSLQILRPINIPTTFTCPLVPLIPLCGILVNTLLFTALPIESLARVFVWSFIGILVYLFYGVSHSNLNDQTVEQGVNKLH